MASWSDTSYTRGRDIVSTAATGAGKTATFWLPMLFEESVEFIVTPLKSLGEQMALNARALNFMSVNITRDNFTPKLIKVSHWHATCISRCSKTFQDITEGKYRVIVIGPELLMDRRFWNLQVFYLFIRENLLGVNTSFSSRCTSHPPNLIGLFRNIDWIHGFDRKVTYFMNTTQHTTTRDIEEGGWMATG
jgi:hypothetical protein